MALTESRIKQIIREEARRVLREGDFSPAVRQALDADRQDMLSRTVKDFPLTKKKTKFGILIGKLERAGAEKLARAIERDAEDRLGRYPDDREPVEFEHRSSESSGKQTYDVYITDRVLPLYNVEIPVDIGNRIAAML
jgi:hypothetical protein